MKRIQIKATFLDEISTDIPHHNWGYEEWDQDFQAMKAIGIDTVVMIRCGLEKFLAKRVLTFQLNLEMLPFDIYYHN